ncbi:MAG: alpha-mannosidase [Isosphaeraceae bacterium]
MPVHILRLALGLGLISVTYPVPAAEAPETAPKPTFWVIPHTHWEGAVFKTREEYLELGLPNILKAMKLLKEQPDFRFVLDQVAYVKPFLDRYPDQERDFRRFLAEGRLQLVGAMDVMPDVNMPGGETFIRQLQYGKQYYRDKLGVDVTTGWLLDSFGHHAQIPQLLTLAGFKSFWHQRGANRPDHPSEYLWEGIDGTCIPAFWLPYSYGLLYGSPHTLPEFEKFMKQRYAMLTPNSHGNDRVGLAGADVSVPEEHLAPLVHAFNEKGDAPFVLKMGVPSDFEVIAAKRTDRPVYRGSLNPIFQGTYSSRIELKQWMRIMEQKLLTAESLGALGHCLGAPFDSDAVWRAWEPVLFNETHDLSSGVMTDHVYDDTIRGYEFSRRVADELIDTGWNALASKIDTSMAEIPVVVFNREGFPRTDLAEVDLGFSQPGLRGITIHDDQGKEVTYQVEQMTNYEDGALQTARIAFLARDIPALGFRVFRVGKRDQHVKSAVPHSSNDDALENPTYRLAFDRATGAIKNLRVKPDDWEVFAGPAGIVSRQDDHGDLWELYRGLDGGSKIAMTTRQEVPKTGQAKFSNEFKDKPGTLQVGPVFSEFHVAHPFGAGKYETTIRTYAELPRIEVTYKLINNEKYVRYQALFPTTIKNGKSVHEIPFGSIARPEGIEFPAQNWVDYGDGKRGLAVLNYGLPGNVMAGGTLMVSLLRAHTLGAYGFGGGYEPGMSSESGFQLGKERTMRLALVPHSGGWAEARIVQQGREFVDPLIARIVGPHTGPLTSGWGFLDVSAPNVVLSDVTPARDGGIVVRIYESAGKATSRAILKLHAMISGAREVNLLEDPGSALQIKNDGVRFDLHPYEIKTFRFQPALPTRR